MCLSLIWDVCAWVKCLAVSVLRTLWFRAACPFRSESLEDACGEWPLPTRGVVAVFQELVGVLKQKESQSQAWTKTRKPNMKETSLDKGFPSLTEGPLTLFWTWPAGTKRGLEQEEHTFCFQNHSPITSPRCTSRSLLVTRPTRASTLVARWLLATSSTTKNSILCPSDHHFQIPHAELLLANIQVGQHVRQECYKAGRGLCQKAGDQLRVDEHPKHLHACVAVMQWRGRIQWTLKSTIYNVRWSWR